MNNEPLIKETVINASVERVWRALTDRDEMEKWYFKIAEFKPQPGFEFSFWGGDKNKQYKHLCKIVDVEENKKLSYTWRYEEYPGNSLVTFELFDEGDKTRVKITHTGLETFATDDKNFARESFSAGWEYILKTSLKNYLEGTK